MSLLDNSRKSLRASPAPLQGSVALYASPLFESEGGGPSTAGDLELWPLGGSAEAQVAAGGVGSGSGAGRSYERGGKYDPREDGPDDGSQRHLYVLPVLLLEFLSLSLTRAVLPMILLRTFGDHVYFVMGVVECVRGLLAFVSCPAFGRISDRLGRKVCLFVTVLGTCAPVCALAILPASGVMALSDAAASELAEMMEGSDAADSEAGGAAALGALTSTSPIGMAYIDPFGSDPDRRRIWVFVILLAVSGLFSSTFTLTFAYISDTVRTRERRVTAYGLALATFGLSYTIGPMAGGYLARVGSTTTAAVSTEVWMWSTPRGSGGSSVPPWPWWCWTCCTSTLYYLRAEPISLGGTKMTSPPRLGRPEPSERR